MGPWRGAPGAVRSVKNHGIKEEKKLLILQQNPRHKSLRSHQVGKTPTGEGIWSSSINMSYRFTWEYGPHKNELTLRHIGTHKIYRSP